MTATARWGPISLRHGMHVAMILSFLFQALSAQEQAPRRWEGSWRGEVKTGVADVPLRLVIEKHGDRYSARMDRLDQAGGTVDADSFKLNGDFVAIGFKKVKRSFQGKLSADGTTIDGTFAGRTSSPLSLVREKASPAVAAVDKPPAGPRTELRVPTPPTVVRGAGKRFIVYELSIANQGESTASVQKIEVLGKGPLASFSGRELSATLPNSRISAGASVLAFLWVTLTDDADALSEPIRHRVTVDGQTVEGAEIGVAKEPVPELGAPLRGEGWRAVNGPANNSPHRRADIPIDGQSYLAQRFAIDWVKVNANGSLSSGDRKDNRNYFGYGADILAVADSMVTGLKDGIPENVPGENSRAVPITLETVGGNYLILDLGGGRYAFYAHLQPGSLQVKVGDHVKRGQVLAKLGNSGNSTAPHLHFHVCDRNAPLQAQGMPYVLDAFEVRGKGKEFEKRERQIPVADEVVRFP